METPKFEKNNTAYWFDIEKLKSEGKNTLVELITKLNCKTTYDAKTPEGSNMHYGRLCNCDDGFLCEHRLEWLINFIDEKYEKML